MKNIILQHYTGILGTLQKLSITNIRSYAERIGADYRFLEGQVFDSRFSSPCQKMIMLDACWDEYDMVVMMDTDMFAVNGLQESVFTSAKGTGLFTPYTEKIFSKCRRMHPTLCDPRYAYWGGCLWRLPRELRTKFRQHIDIEELKAFSSNFEDEGIMHRLAVKTKTPQDALPHEWSYCSYLPEPGLSKIVHIRDKTCEGGPRLGKLANYHMLNMAGVLT